MPVVAIPSTKYFCARKNNVTTGIIETNDMANTLFHGTVASASIDILKASETGYFTLFMYIRD